MSQMTSTDRHWEKSAKENPYFGVLSDPKFFSANLNEELLQEFFSSCERHIEHVFRTVRESVKPAFRPVRVLDYGCGVGRLLVPLANRSQEVTGVDVSPSMLIQARENCDRLCASSVCLLHVDDLRTLAPSTFDLVHSFIVFQHIPVARGELILSRLIELIAKGGVGAIHITFRDTHSAIRRNLRALRQRIPLVHGMINLARGRRYSTGMSQMNSYSMNRIFETLIKSQCSNLHVEFSDHGGFLGAMLYFEKSPKVLL